MKPDRNSPCPCGSGKKYKKCCLDKDSALGRKNLPSIDELNEMEELYREHSETFDEELAGRTPEEAAYDNVVLTEYNNGKTIEESIRIANERYPSEALQYDSKNLDDIETHYEYLSNHLEFKKSIDRIKRRYDTNSNIALGIAWYDCASDYIAMKNFASDKENWDDSYEAWLKNSEKKIDEIKKSGIDPIKVRITVNGLREFCAKEAKKPNAETRASYISFLLEAGYPFK